MSRTTKISRLLLKYSLYKISKEELCKLLASGAFKMTGVAGPFVVRYKDGKPIISERPVLFRMSMTPAAIKGRNNFTAGIRFAKFLADIQEIKNLWQPKQTVRKSAWLNLVKYNYTGDIPGIKNKITPSDNHFRIDEISTLTEEFRITINHKFNSREKLHIVIVPYNPITRNYDIIYAGTDHQKNEIKLSEDQIKILKRYTNYIMYTAVIRTIGSKTEWSNTVVTEGTIAKTNIEGQTDQRQESYFILIYNYKKLPNPIHLLFSG